jgi:hypothetical protein
MHWYWDKGEIMPELAKENYGNHVTVGGAQTVTGAKTFGGGAAIKGAASAAAAGYVGEYRRQAATSAVALVGSSTVTVVEDTLPAGLWLCFVAVATTVSASGNSIYHNISATSEEFMAYAAGATGKARHMFVACVISNGTTKIQGRVQCLGTVTGTGLDIGTEESSIVSVRIA